MGRWARKPVNHTSWVALVTPTDRPKSVRNRCLIELFCGVVCVVTLPFWHFCWCRGFCHRTESDLFLFLSAISKRVEEKSVIGSSDLNVCLFKWVEQSALKVVQSACLNFHRWCYIWSSFTAAVKIIGKWSLPQQSSWTSHEKRSNSVGLAKDKSIAEYVPFPEWRNVCEPSL